MARANSLWRAPRIHGELLKLGIKISELLANSLILRVYDVLMNDNRRR
jgi:hypothetical protein